MSNPVTTLHLRHPPALQKRLGSGAPRYNRAQHLYHVWADPYANHVQAFGATSLARGGHHQSCLVLLDIADLHPDDLREARPGRREYDDHSSKITFVACLS